MAIRYVEIVSQAFAVARGSDQKNIFNIWHWRTAADAVSVNKSNIQAAFQTAIMTPMLAFLNVDYTQTANTVRFFDDALDAPIPFVQTGVGLVTGDRLETFIAAVVRLKSANKGKFARGNKHLGPVSESQSSGDVLTSGAITLLTAIATAVGAGFTDSDGNLWLPIVKSSHAPAQYMTNPVTVVSFDVIAAVVNHTLGSMRRRKVKTVS